MRIKTVGHYLGLIITILGLFMLLPLVCSLVYGESCSPAFAISIGISIGFGLLLWRLLPVGEGGLSRREAILLVVGGWVLVSAFGTLPYVLAGTFHSFIDAFFESVSGFTTTGATVFTSVETQFRGILLWRSITQWLGGMGIITLFVALFPLLGIGAAHLVEAEMPGPQTDRLTPRIRDTAKAVWILYVGFSFLEFILLIIAGMPAFDALNVTFTTMPTGGFTPTDLSIGAYNSPFIEIIVLIFMVFAGVNFGLFYFLAWKRQVRQLFRNPEFRFYIILLVGAFLLVAIDLTRNMGMSVGESLRYGSFQVVSIMTTTGYASANFDVWPVFAKAVLLVLMIIGASAGSTGGALKVVRLLVLFKYAYRRILLTFNPRAVIPLKFGGNVLSESVISGIMGMAIVYFAIIIIGFLVMSAVGLDHVSALSSVLATIGNVGPGLGLVGPMSNYLLVPPLGKAFLTVCMLVGRLELFTALMLLSPSFWKWR
ncbi:TrkH family potassium uptake protein [Chloroflexota bacterium]